MKIITKYKDYYDYLIGIYGEDPLIILDRRKCVNMKNILERNYFNISDNYKLVLFIGGYKIEGFMPGIKSPYYNNGKIYYGESLKAIDEFNTLEDNYKNAKNKYKSEYNKRYYHNKNSIKWELDNKNIKLNEISFINMGDRDSKQCIFDITIKKDTQNYNEKNNCPILCYLETKYFNHEPGFHFYPNLSELNLNTFITPENVYKMIYNWISEQKTKTENKIDSRTDIEKLEGKGFDKKLSFRNVK